MLQEERLHSGQDSTWSSLVLEDSILHPLVEIEALCPGSVEGTPLILKEKLLDASCIFGTQVLPLHLRGSLRRGRVALSRRVAIQVVLELTDLFVTLDSLLCCKLAALLICF